MTDRSYDVLTTDGGTPVKMWTRGVPVDDNALEQLKKTACLPFIYKWIAAMPDVHQGLGATIGSVIPTRGAVIPAAIGVDIGCGMMAVPTRLSADDLPASLHDMRQAIERAIPHGFEPRRGHRDTGSWGNPPPAVIEAWHQLEPGFQTIVSQCPRIKNSNNLTQLGTLGSGNHFIEICLDQKDRVWFMLHSGSRGVGHTIGQTYIDLAKKDMKSWFIDLPDPDLAYFPEGTPHFDEYMFAVQWAQEFAKVNREIMMNRLIEVVADCLDKPFTVESEVVHCHHNYVAKEHHYGQNVFVTRKGAVRARLGEMGIIPGSMGARSFIVRGLGNEESFMSCAHGAGRMLSRNAAKKNVSLEQHIQATQNVECRKDQGVLDETPAAYKPIDAVMAAQKDLVEIVHTLRQVVCVKG